MNATETNNEIAKITEILLAAGEMFSGGSLAAAESAAKEWADRDFGPNGVQTWIDAGCWSPATADELYPTTFYPDRHTLEYKDGRDGDAMYDLCNGDCKLADLCW